MCNEILKYFGYKIVKINNDEIISPPNYLEDIDYNEVYNILSAEFPNATLLLADNKYRTTTKDELIRFLKWDMTDSWKYVSEFFDCDDFSNSIFGSISNPDWGCLPFGIVWAEVPGGGHAINCFISSDREVFIIEPQTDVVMKCPKDWKPYLIMM